MSNETGTTDARGPRAAAGSTASGPATPEEPERKPISLAEQLEARMSYERRMGRGPGHDWRVMRDRLRGRGRGRWT